ncbi:MAG: efflux RND transporter periplasmic adaptor subunit [Deltaproteobacteria bacterium]|nr:efflux RND transporter periplasmic adaptor subunit [Deltaproteobacteria bacterium]
MKKLMLLLVCAGIIGGGYWWLWREPERAVSYVTARIERGTIARLVTATGTVNPVTSVQVGSYVSGPIRKLFADFNSPVKKGQRVAQIDPRLFTVKVKQAEANLTTARAQIEKDRADLDFKRDVQKRMRDLFERNLIAKQEVEAAERDYAQALAQQQLDQARLEQVTAALEEARVNLDYTDIVSPVDGVVVSRSVNVGQTVAASFQTPVLFLIAEDLTKMQINTNVSESDIGVVREKQKAFFTVDAYPDRQFSGTVSQVRNAPQTVQNVVTYDVVVNVDNSDLALKPGMTASLSLITAQRENVLKLPLAALRFRPKPTGKDGAKDETLRHPPAQGVSKEQKGEGPRQVWRQTNEKALVAVPVQLGISDETSAELLDGTLQEGEEIVIGSRSDATGDSETTLPGFGMRWRR